MAKKQEMTCEVSDIVLHKGVEYYVAEVIESGNERTKKCPAGVRSIVSVCRIMSDGQVLFNSPRYIDRDWEHTGGRG